MQVTVENMLSNALCCYFGVNFQSLSIYMFCGIGARDDSALWSTVSISMSFFSILFIYVLHLLTCTMHITQEHILHYCFRTLQALVCRAAWATGTWTRVTFVPWRYIQCLIMLNLHCGLETGVVSGVVGY